MQILVDKEFFHQSSFCLNNVIFIYPASKQTTISPIQLIFKQRSFIQFLISQEKC